MVPLTTSASASEAAQAKLAKLQKKLKKLQASRPDGSDQDEASEHAAAEAKLKKKVNKLQLQVQGALPEPAAASSDGAAEAEEKEEEAPKGKAGKKNKKAKRSADADGTAEQEGQEEEQQPKKKAKQANGAVAVGKQQHRPHAGVDVGLAEVGNVELARSGKPIRKQLYTEHPDVAKLTAEQVQKLMEERETCVEGSGIKPLQAFEHTGLPAAMLHATRNFATPSPIQAQCWPIVLSGHDLIGIAATGSGKTLGFGLPALRHIAAQKEAGVVKGKGPFALVMAPTRELALQIAEVLEESGSKCGVRSVCVYGGVPKTEQVKALKQGVDIVIGTPGRLEDLMVNDGTCSLQQVTYFVLDEADRMLDLGFEPHIRTIASHIRADRQTLMFSATWPQAVQKLASQFLTHPVKVTIGSQDLSASHTIKQVVEVIEPFARDERLLALLKQYHSSRTNRIIIFVLYKKEAPRVEQLLQRKGFKALAIHGDISQDKRTQAVERFKDGSIPLLIATDVAARGLDIPNVEVVINYSFPLTVEDYVHRIGRTGRAGKTGVAHTFFSAASDKLRAGELINVLREAEQPVPEALLKFGTAVKKKESKMYGAHFKDVDHTAKAKKMTFDSDDE